MTGFRFYASNKGQFDPEFVNYVADLERALDAEAYWQELIPMLTDAQQACERIGDDAKRARLILALAQMHTNLGFYRQALVWLKSAIALAQQSGNVETLAKGHLQIGWTHIYLGDLMESLEHLAQARQLAAQCNQLEILASSYHFTGRAYFELGDYERSLEYFHSELRLPSEANAPGVRINSFHRRAETLIEMGRVKLAERILLRCVRDARLLGVVGNTAPYLRALGRAKLRQGNIPEPSVSQCVRQ